MRQRSIEAMRQCCKEMLPVVYERTKIEPGVDTGNSIYVVDSWCGHTKSDTGIEKQDDLIKQHQPLIEHRPDRWCGLLQPG